MGAKLWYVTGYLGHKECHGPEDYNLTKYIYFDQSFGQTSVIDLLYYYFKKKYRYVVINAKELNNA